MHGVRSWFADRARLSAPIWACALAAGVAFAPPAAARTSPNPAGRTILDPGLPVGKASAVAVPMARAGGAVSTSATAVLVPLPAGAVQLDSTYYDLQDMGSLGQRLVVGPDGRVHATWQDDFCNLDAGGCPPNPNLPQPYPQRGMNYALRTAGTWAHLGKVADPDIRGCCITELFGGFGTLSVTPTGRAAISQHMNEEGCDLRGNFYLQDAPGGSTYAAYLTPINGPSFLFPQVTAVNNGSFVVLAEVPRGGVYDETEEFRISRLAASGTLFTCPVGWQCGPWTSIIPTSNFRDGRGAFPVIASASDGRVGVAVTDFGGNVFLIESANGSFGAGTTIRNLTQYSDASITATDSTSTQYRPFIHCHLAYNDTTPNVVWSEIQARRSGANIVYADYRSRIRHWSSTRGLSVVKQVSAGEADHYDDIDNGLNGPLAGFNTVSVDWPQVGFSPDGLETYVAWLRFTDSQIDPTADAGLPGIITGIGFGDIALSVTRPSETWSPPQNLTQTPTTDERFFSLATRNPGGVAHVLFQASATNEAGVVLIGDRGTTPGTPVRRIAYLERPITGTVVAVGDEPRLSPSMLRVLPNPALGRAHFALGGQGGTIEVYSVGGRRLARVSAVGGTAQWDGRDEGGRPAPSGVYFARAQGGSEAAVKFMFLR